MSCLNYFVEMLMKVHFLSIGSVLQIQLSHEINIKQLLICSSRIHKHNNISILSGLSDFVQCRRSNYFTSGCPLSLLILNTL